jgi:siroheme synthase
VSTLGEIASANIDIPVPAIVVIGRVVRLRPALDWVGAIDRHSDTPL